MDKKWILLAVALLVVLSGYLLLGHIPSRGPLRAEREATRAEVKAVLEGDKQRASTMQSEATPKDWFPYGGAHYPDLPGELFFAQSGKRVTLLRGAASKHEIDAWADQNEMSRVLDLRSSKVRRCILVMGDGGTCGVYSWVVYLYGYYLLKDGDPKPWKLLYVGGAGLHGMYPDSIGRVYIDDELGCLVFADSRTGKVSYATRIAREIELMQEH